MKKLQTCDEPNLIYDDDDNDDDTSASDFVEGLSRLLYEIYVHLSSNVVATPRSF